MLVKRPLVVGDDFVLIGFKEALWKGISMNRENAWTTYEEADIKALEGLCKEYKDFLSNGKTERECVAQSSNWQRKLDIRI